MIFGILWLTFGLALVWLLIFLIKNVDVFKQVNGLAAERRRIKEEVLAEYPIEIVNRYKNRTPFLAKRSGEWPSLADRPSNAAFLSHPAPPELIEIKRKIRARRPRLSSLGLSLPKLLYAWGTYWLLIAASLLGLVVGLLIIVQNI
jgi:hypothetical protein